MENKDIETKVEEILESIKDITTRLEQLEKDSVRSMTEQEIDNSMGETI